MVKSSDNNEKRGKPTTIDAYFKRENVGKLESQIAASSFGSTISPPTPSISVQHNAHKVPRTEKEEIDISSVERDPGLRRSIETYPTEQRDKIRRAYIMAGPYQPRRAKYPLSGSTNHRCSFQGSWFDKFSSWLEYSKDKDAAFCLPCYVFSNLSGIRSDTNAFSEGGFRNWKEINDGKDCAFLGHIGTNPNTPHNICVRACNELIDQSQHIDRDLQIQTFKMILEDRLRLKVSIVVIRWLTLQGCAFGVHDESVDSSNYIDLIKLIGSFNSIVKTVVQENALDIAGYNSPTFQKDILHIFARKVRAIIREEIGDAKYCIIIDDVPSDSYREQMAVVLRYVDEEGQVQERFYDLVQATDMTSLTLKNEITSTLSCNNLHIYNIRGQGYGGAGNMRGEWNELQGLFLKECPYAYYIHCLAHPLQLALVTAAKAVFPIYNFLTNLTLIVNLVSDSPEWRDQLGDAHAFNVVSLTANDELETSGGLNQIGSSQRAGDTQWSSHLASILSLLKAYDATYSVLESIMEEGNNNSQRGSAHRSCDAMVSFEFIFILHMMRDILEITHDLCQALHSKCLDFLNVLSLLSTTRTSIQKLRETGWEILLDKVKSFCEEYDIDIPDMAIPYKPERGRNPFQLESISMEHYYRITLFIATIDIQWQELNSRFDEKSMELLRLSSTFDPSGNYKLFNVDHVFELATKFYPSDFTEQEMFQLKIQAQHYQLDVPNHLEFKELSTISELCLRLKSTRKSTVYPLIDRLIRLILTLPVITTTERPFPAMKLAEIVLDNQMEDQYIGDYLITYIEREIAQKFDIDSIIDEFYDMKDRRV